MTRTAAIIKTPLLHIVLSRHEEYGDGAKRIKDACEYFDVLVNQSDVDEFLINFVDVKTRVFFLTNDDRVSNTARSLIKSGFFCFKGCIPVYRYQSGASLIRFHCREITICQIDD